MSRRRYSFERQMSNSPDFPDSYGSSALVNNDRPFTRVAYSTHKQVSMSNDVERLCYDFHQATVITKTRQPIYRDDSPQRALKPARSSRYDEGSNSSYGSSSPSYREPSSRSAYPNKVMQVVRRASPPRSSRTSNYSSRDNSYDYEQMGNRSTSSRRPVYREATKSPSNGRSRYNLRSSRTSYDQGSDDSDCY